MDFYAASSRPPTRRKPLADATHRTNTQGTLSQNIKRKSASSPSRRLPHNDSFVLNGTLSVHQGIDSQHSPGNKRISQLSKEGQPDSKRSSAISYASTNASGTGRRRKTHIG